MDAGRIGRSIRAIRIRLGWRQSDLADAARVSRSYISKLERGLIGNADLDRLERVCRALGADLDVRVRWRGEGLDRLLDEAHAVLVDRVVDELKAAGWQVALGTVNRRRIARLASTFDAALPIRGHAVRRWLRKPTGSIAGLLFLSDSPAGGVRRATAGRQRVNRPRKARVGTE